jgi:O-acetyl-ADP-ribose deacetylase (regulator of RNase III)
MNRLIGNCRLFLERGDITRSAVDAIVNAANAALAGGGGVDGAIHRAGGPTIMAELDRIRPGLGGRLAVGAAVATDAGDLPARRVIHAVGPRYGLDPDPAARLADAYRNSLCIARDERLRSIAFPSISTGAYGYPIGAAARIALSTVAAELREHPGPLRELRFVLFSESDLAAYSEVLRGLEP